LEFRGRRETRRKSLKDRRGDTGTDQSRGVFPTNPMKNPTGISRERWLVLGWLQFWFSQCPKAPSPVLSTLSRGRKVRGGGVDAAAPRIPRAPEMETNSRGLASSAENLSDRDGASRLGSGNKDMLIRDGEVRPLK
jgi:hypothetical protein